MKKLMILLLISSLYITAEERVIYAAYTSWEPYTYTVDAKPMGFELEIFQNVMERMDYSVIFIEMPWKRCLQNLKSGEMDVVISMLINEEREEYTLFPEEHISTTDFMLISLKESAIESTNPLINLKDYKIGSILGFHYGDEFDNANYLDKVEVGDSELLLELLLKKRFDIVIGNKTVIMNSFHKKKLTTALVFHEPPVKSDKLYVGFSKNESHEVLSKEFSSGLKLFKETDEYREILNRYHIN